MTSSPPDGAGLLELERAARRSGSGIAADQLLGPWNLVQTWPRRGGQPPAAVASTLLRALQAQLAFERPGPAGEHEAPSAPLLIRNSVRLGPLELRFCGEARLEGKRPLLVFDFERLQFRLGGGRLLDLPLPRKAPFTARRVRALPFFALIGGGADAGWLAARGRGGGLALWIR
jgi:hypothetical protein